MLEDPIVAFCIAVAAARVATALLCIAPVSCDTYFVLFLGRICQRKSDINQGTGATSKALVTPSSTLLISELPFGPSRVWTEVYRAIQAPGWL